MTNNIDIICYYDNLHKPLFDLFFYPSYEKYLINNFSLKPFFFKTDNSVSHWKSSHWCEILINRFDVLKEYIIRNNNQWCIFSDIDILFLENFYSDIDLYLSNNLHDIYYMAEYIRAPASVINGGFFLFRCNQIVYDYFDFIQQETKKMELPNDQIAIQDILKYQKFPIKQSVLSRFAFITNNNPRNKIITLLKNDSAKVFHATGTGNVMEKLQVLSTIHIKKYEILGTNLWIP